MKMESVIAVLLSALIAVESGGRADAVGRSGESIGILQIHPGCVHDINRVTGRAYTLRDRWNAAKSREMCTAYLSHYGRLYERRTGRNADAEVLARMWNGGPRGYAKESTRRYWRKVQAELRRQGHARLLGMADTARKREGRRAYRRERR